MNIIIIKILISLHYIVCVDDCTEQYKRNHPNQVNQAIEIYNNEEYHEAEDGGVVIDVEISPVE